MAVRLDVNGMMAEAIGDEGLNCEEVDALAPRAAEIARDLKTRRAAGELPFYELPQQQEAAKAITRGSRLSRESMSKRGMPLPLVAHAPYRRSAQATRLC